MGWPIEVKLFAFALNRLEIRAANLLDAAATKPDPARVAVTLSQTSGLWANSLPQPSQGIVTCFRTAPRSHIRQQFERDQYAQLPIAARRIAQNLLDSWVEVEVWTVASYPLEQRDVTFQHRHAVVLSLGNREIKAALQLLFLQALSGSNTALGQGARQGLARGNLDCPLEHIPLFC